MAEPYTDATIVGQLAEVLAELLERQGYGYWINTDPKTLTEVTAPLLGWLAKQGQLLPDGAEVPPTSKDVRPFIELSGSGLLWLINATVFHPRGFALSIVVGADGQAAGWKLLGDGSEPWRFDGDMDHRFTAANATFDAARRDPR